MRLSRGQYDTTGPNLQAQPGAIQVEEGSSIIRFRRAVNFHHGVGLPPFA